MVAAAAFIAVSVLVFPLAVGSMLNAALMAADSLADPYDQPSMVCGASQELV